eukprot:CAMPEP_0196168006 /NCGR_PEP_ID=MMETSP0911-20130528/2977_1 /TAXON_ID=49265 /ORGANISM="Thalassiosira rotula, Strain GSO102" /LENGTH=68 /DNA_ID=CAMNT_0041433969 /DNA_START=279 /DNA_END=485 /DNA_ORIENTATION=+
MGGYSISEKGSDGGHASPSRTGANATGALLCRFLPLPFFLNSPHRARDPGDCALRASSTLAMWQYADP